MTRTWALLKSLKVYDLSTGLEALMVVDIITSSYLGFPGV